VFLVSWASLLSVCVIFNPLQNILAWLTSSLSYSRFIAYLEVLNKDKYQGNENMIPYLSVTNRLE